MRLAWPASLLIAAALSPTDPVFVSALFGFESVPRMIKHVLNIESGMNDGLALPIVLVMMRVVLGGRSSFIEIIIDLLIGVCIGGVIPWVCIKLEQVKLFRPARRFPTFVRICYWPARARDLIPIRHQSLPRCLCWRRKHRKFQSTREGVV